MTDLSALETTLKAFTLGVPRILITLSMLSFLSRQNTTGLIRVAVATAFTLPALPYLIEQIKHDDIGTALMFFLFLKEAALGACIGLAAAIPFWAAEGIGFVIDNQRGAATSTMASPTSGNETSPLGVLTNQAYMVMFLSLGGLPLILGLIYQSYALWPPTSGLPHFSAQLPNYYLGLFDSLIRTAIVFAAPAMVAMLLAELGLAIVSLFAPQMQVFFLAMPIKSGIAIFILAIYFSTLLQYFAPGIYDMPGLLNSLSRYMR